MPNKYTLSNGLKLEKAAIDRKIRQAKEAKLNEHFDKFGFYCCEKCKKNTCLPITVSHIISVNDCQRNRKTELAWDLNNMKVLGLPCHRKYDGLDLRFTK